MKLSYIKENKVFDKNLKIRLHDSGWFHHLFGGGVLVVVAAMRGRLWCWWSFGIIPCEIEEELCCYEITSKGLMFLYFHVTRCKMSGVEEEEWSLRI